MDYNRLIVWLVGVVADRIEWTRKPRKAAEFANWI
jgi:hypothetical protein